MRFLRRGAALVALICPSAFAQVLVSSGADGLGIGGTAYGFATSTDGRFVSYCFRPTPIDPWSIDQRADAYVKDRTTGALVLVSLRESGAGFANAQCLRTAVSDDGRYVAFGIRDFDLPSLAEYTEKQQVYRRDVQASTTVLVSRNSAGSPFLWDVGLEDMTPDGQLVLLDVQQPNTGRRAGDEYGLVLRNVGTGANLQVATNPPGNGPFDIGLGSVSRDGRWVGYSSNWPQDPTYPGYVRQAYVFDAMSGSSRLVSRSAGGTPSDTDVVVRRLARNGRHLVFASDSQVFGIPFNTGGRIFRVDVQNGQLDLVTRKNDGTETSVYLYEVGWYDADISEDGNLVSFRSHMALGNSSLEQPGNFLGTVLYIRNIAAGFASLGAVNDLGGLPGSPQQHRLAGDGSQVIFAASVPGYSGPLTGNPYGELLFAADASAPVDLNVVLASRGEEAGPYAGQRYQKIEAILTNQSSRIARLARLDIVTPDEHRLVAVDQPGCGTRLSDGSPPIYCNLASLAPGASFSVRMTIDITDAVPATLQAVVTQLDPDPDTADNSDSLPVGAGDGGGGGGGGGVIDLFALGLLAGAGLRRSRRRPPTLPG